MTNRTGGARKRTRGKLSKRARTRGKVTISRILKKFKIGDKVAISIEPAIHDGMPHPKYQGKHGVDARKITRGDRAEWSRWIYYRASFFTQFVRDLRTELGKLGRPVPIGLRVQLQSLDANTEWGMDVRALVEQGLVQELCLMNGYLHKPQYVHRPDEIATQAAPYFELCRGRDVKLIGGLHGPSINPERTLEYTRFFHESGFDGVAIYESDMMVNSFRHRPMYRRLKFAQRIAEPWVSVSSSSREDLVPWQPQRRDRAPWWQLNLPEEDTLEELVVAFGTQGAPPAAVTLSASPDGRDWAMTTRGVAVSAEARQVTIACGARGRRFRLALGAAGLPMACIQRVTAKLSNGAVVVGEQRDGLVKITSHEDGVTVAPGSTFEAKAAADAPKGPIDFLWDGALVRTERAPAFTWSTPKGFRPGAHRLKVRLHGSRLTPSFDEITVKVEGASFEFGLLPEGAKTVYESDFEDVGGPGLPKGFFLSRGYGDHEERAAPDGRAEVVLAGGSRALRLLWPASGPRMKVHLPLGRRWPSGFVEFEFMVRPAKTAALLALMEADAYPSVLYLTLDGTMRSNSRKQTKVPLPRKVTTTPGRWRHVRWAWDARSDRQTLWVDDLSQPILENGTQRQPMAKGIDQLVFYFFEARAAELFIDNLRVVAY